MRREFCNLTDIAQLLQGTISFLREGTCFRLMPDKTSSVIQLSKNY
jgi:hypothetical protein